LILIILGTLVILCLPLALSAIFRSHKQTEELVPGITCDDALKARNYKIGNCFCRKRSL
jgi:hypothetical protein